MRLPPRLRVHHLPILRQHQRLHVRSFFSFIFIVRLIETLSGNVTLATSTSTHFALWGEDRSQNSGLRGWAIGQSLSRKITFIATDKFGYQPSDPPVQYTLEMLLGDEKVRGVLQIDPLVHIKPIESNEEKTCGPTDWDTGNCCRQINKIGVLRDTARTPQPPTNPSTGHQMSRQNLAQNEQKC